MLLMVNCQRLLWQAVFFELWQIVKRNCVISSERRKGELCNSPPNPPRQLNWLQKNYL